MNIIFCVKQKWEVALLFKWSNIVTIPLKIGFGFGILMRNKNREMNIMKICEDHFSSWKLKGEF